MYRYFSTQKNCHFTAIRCLCNFAVVLQICTNFYGTVYINRELSSAIKEIKDKMRGALFENFIIMEAMKRRYNQGKESNLYFYRDSHQNEIDLILKSSSGLYGIEIKSAMTYHADFEKALKQMDGWINEPVLGKAVVYAGSLENTVGDIKLLNYTHLREILE